jgi:hypothetical protein
MLGAAIGVLGMVAATQVGFPARLWPRQTAAIAAQPSERVPDALGASLARSLAETGQQVLRGATNSSVRTACEAAIAEADAAALRAAEDARARPRNAQNVQLVLTAEDGYLAAARRCLREARPICQAAPRRIEGCAQLVGVTEAELASTRALRASRGL